jgi:hypothetical protein
MARGKVFLFTVVLPVLLGALIYTSGFIILYLQPIRNYLPDGLWAFALISILYFIWQGQPKLLWLIAAAVVFVLFELFQATGIIEGTGDPIDVLIYFFFSGISIFIHRNIIVKTYAFR